MQNCLFHGGYLVGNVPSGLLETCKTSGWAWGSTKWRMGTHKRNPQPRQKDNLQFLQAVRTQPHTAGRCLLENPGTMSNAPLCVTFPTCLSIHHSVSRHIPCKISLLPAIHSFNPERPATSGTALNGTDRCIIEEADFAGPKQIFILEFRSILERYVEMGLETLRVSPCSSQSLLQTLQQAECSQSWSKLGERQSSDLCSRMWLIELWVQTFKSETRFLSAFQHIRGKEFKDVGDKISESNIIFESSLQLEENRESCLLSSLIKMQSNAFVHSVNMTISSSLLVIFKQI